jgi:hypothetical protein
MHAIQQVIREIKKLGGIDISQEARDLQQLVNGANNYLQSTNIPTSNITGEIFRRRNKAGEIITRKNIACEINTQNNIAGEINKNIAREINTQNNIAGKTNTKNKISNITGEIITRRNKAGEIITRNNISTGSERRSDDCEMKQSLPRVSQPIGSK